MAWINPKIDWITNPINPRAQDFNRIEGNIAFLKEEIETKKGLLVDAINTKQELVTIESSYQEMADAINIINQNPRIHTGSSIAMKSGSDYYITANGLPFRPSIILARYNSALVGRFAGWWHFVSFYVASGYSPGSSSSGSSYDYITDTGFGLRFLYSPDLTAEGVTINWTIIE